MEKIIIAVGSTRRPKLNAVTEAAQTFGPLLAASATPEVIGVEVESGVGHTPSSRDELMRGARQRAEALVLLAREQNQPWRYFVGVEGGLDVMDHAMTDVDASRGSVVRPRDPLASTSAIHQSVLPTPREDHADASASGEASLDSRRRVFLESWAFVTDGTRGHFGRSGAVELPESLAHEVLDKGIELSEAIDRYAMTQDPARFAGASGIRNAQGAWGVLSAGLITRQEAFRVAVIAAFAPFYNPRMYEVETNAAEKRETARPEPRTQQAGEAPHGKDVSRAAAR
jgi:inosine/xanthosine triphosphatase